MIPGAAALGLAATGVELAESEDADLIVVGTREPANTGSGFLGPRGNRAVMPSPADNSSDKKRFGRVSSAAVHPSRWL